MNAIPRGRSGGEEDAAVVGWLRAAAGQVRVDPPAELLPAALAAVPAARRRRRLAVAIPAGAAALAAALIAVVVLAGGRSGNQATVVPAVIAPTEVPGPAGGHPLHLRYVDTPRLLALTDADRDAIDAHCATPYQSQPPPDRERLYMAVADRWGLEVMVADAGGGGSCRTFTGSGGAPDFTGLNGPLLWSPGQHDLARPPASPVEVFNSGEDSSGGPVEWNARQFAAGQVSEQVALLVAALPTGEAVVVPFDPATGAFITRIQATVPDVAQYDAILQMPLTLYAYDSAGALLAQVTGTCGQVPVCNGEPVTDWTSAPTPATTAPTASVTTPAGETSPESGVSATLFPTPTPPGASAPAAQPSA